MSQKEYPLITQFGVLFRETTARCHRMVTIATSQEYYELTTFLEAQIVEGFGAQQKRPGMANASLFSTIL